MNVTERAEKDYQKWIREMHQEWVFRPQSMHSNKRPRMIWENQGVGSFYLDGNSGKNTALYPRSHTHYWWSTLIPKQEDFVFSGVQSPWLMRLTSNKALRTYGVGIAAGVAAWWVF